MRQLHPCQDRPRARALGARGVSLAVQSPGVRSEGQDQGDNEPKALPPPHKAVRLGAGPGGHICIESPRMLHCNPVQGGIPVESSSGSGGGCLPPGATLGEQQM